MTEREKLIEICQPILNLCNSNGCRLCLYEAYKPFCISTAIAEILLRNGVVLVDTNSVKRENLPLIQQAFNMPLDELAQLVEAKQAGRIVERPCKVFDKTFLLLESDSDEYEIYESKCVRITDNGYGVYYSMAYKCPAIGNTLEFGISDFGKCVFLNREEAENALAERSK